MNKMLIDIKNGIEFTRDIVLAILSALLISQFIFAHTKVPTGSMIPTINIDDHMILNYLPFYLRDPEIGELVIFKQDSMNVVKRVIAKGGDVVDLQEGFVIVNNEPQYELEYLRDVGVTYPQVVTFPYTVPENHYFVLGDNRTNSADSRTFGAINRDQIFATTLVKFNYHERAFWHDNELSKKEQPAQTSLNTGVDW